MFVKTFLLILFSLNSVYAISKVSAYRHPQQDFQDIIRSYQSEALEAWIRDRKLSC